MQNLVVIVGVVILLIGMSMHQSPGSGGITVRMDRQGCLGTLTMMGGFGLLALASSMGD